MRSGAWVLVSWGKEFQGGPVLSWGAYLTPACFSPKAWVLRGGWWVLRPPGPASRELGEALTLGVSGEWGSWNTHSVPLASQLLALIR